MPSKLSRARAGSILGHFDFVGGKGSRYNAVEAVAEMFDLSRLEGYMAVKHCVEMALIAYDPLQDTTGATPRLASNAISVAEARDTVDIPEPPRVESPLSHVFEKHTNCEIPNCRICDGGLSICTVCGQAEIDLEPTCSGISF